MQITNTQPGPRGVNTVMGPVVIDPGQTINAEVYAREQAHIEAAGWFEVSGDYAANPDAPVSAAPDATLADKDAEIEALKAQIAALSAPPVLIAKHKGSPPGNWAIYSGDEEVMEGLKREDAEAFNDLENAAKAQFVADLKPA